MVSSSNLIDDPLVPFLITSWLLPLFSSEITPADYFLRLEYVLLDFLQVDSLLWMIDVDPARTGLLMKSTWVGELIPLLLQKMSAMRGAPSL